MAAPLTSGTLATTNSLLSQLILEPSKTPSLEAQASRELLRRAATTELQRRKLIHLTSAFTNDYTPGWVHQEVAEHLEAFMTAVERKQSPRLMIFLPPRTGKTQLVSRCFPAYLMGHHPEWEVIAATFGQDLADDIGRYVRSIVNEPLYHKLFPESRIEAGSNAANRLDTTSRGGYRAVGRGGALTGRGAHVLIIDDPLKDDSEADSASTQEGLRSWYVTSARTRLAPGGGIIIVQTLWSLNDLPLFLLEAQDKDPKADRWKVYKYPAIATEDEPHRKKGEALHPVRFDAEELERTRASFYATGKSRWWNSLYQQNPVDEEGNFFRKDWIRYYDKLPEDLNWYMGVDYAVSTRNSADQTAIVRFGVDKEGDIYLDPEIFHDRVTSLQAINTVLRMAKAKKVWQIGSEKGVIENAIGPLFAQRCRELKYYPFIHKLTRSQSKHVYAAVLQGRMQQGKVLFPRTKFVEETLIPELLAFRPDADNKSDNLIDALTNGLLMVNTLIPAKPAKEEVLEDDVVPGSMEDLMRRKHHDILKLETVDRNSLFSWRKKAKKTPKFW